ncbi:MAG: hypothetical protein GDA37_05060 [Ekhidna sp.]|nr:hypothetical protein [Ekhidna sp.]
MPDVGSGVAAKRATVKGSAGGSEQKRKAVNVHELFVLRLFGSFWGYLFYYADVRSLSKSVKLLLDENVPRKIKNDLPEFEVFTVQEMNWNGKKKGELLALMLNDGFQVLITTDKNLQNQQNFNKYPVPVLMLNVKLLTYPHVFKLLPELKNRLNSDLPNGSTFISQQESNI